MSDNQGQEVVLATPQHRLGAVAVDIGLVFVTSFIGWGIWSLIVWSKGQTPGKQLLKLRVLNQPTGMPATWGQMLIRQVLIGWAIAVPYFILYWLPDSISSGLRIFAGIAAIFLYFGILILDIVWVFGPTRRRLIDYWAGTIVVNEAK